MTKQPQELDKPSLPLPVLILKGLLAMILGFLAGFTWGQLV